jgi:hypothetical protein
VISKSKIISSSPKNRRSLANNTASPESVRNRFDDNSKVVFKELANEKLLSESPGFVYDAHIKQTAINRN